MLSVLVPVYNFDIVTLANVLKTQCDKAGLSYEIIFWDDDSNDSEIQSKNKCVNDLEHVYYHLHTQNLGNTKVRQALAEKAQFDWLLFLDADTIPVTLHFISNYLEAINNSEAQAVCGGISYQNFCKKEEILRWKYGKKYETDNSRLAMWKGANFLIKKELFLNFDLIEFPENYGYEDVVFGLNLEKQKVPYALVHNPVYHLGLENSERFLYKTEMAIKNAYFLWENYPEIADKIKLIQWAKQLKSSGLRPLSRWVFDVSKPLLKKQLSSPSPSLFLFQCYKLGLLVSIWE